MHFLHNSLGKEKSDKTTRKSGFNWLSKFENFNKEKGGSTNKNNTTNIFEIFLPFY